MKQAILIITFFSSFLVFSQNKSICLDAGGWTYIVSLNDSTMEYTFSSDGNLVETGIVEWERGKFKISENKIILKSNKPFIETTLQKVVLVKVNEVTEDTYYFKSCWGSRKENEIWKIKKVKNGGFIDHLNKKEKETHNSK
jgi:hypothetical protein